MNTQAQQTRWTPFLMLVSVFFFWGFVAASNTILIPYFKDAFQLSQFQSQLVDFAFYIAYGVSALVYFLISITKGDLLNKIGYKKGLMLGLLISAIGALAFAPSAYINSYALMLGALFVVGLGFGLQQIVANPYVIALGPQKTGAHRISFAGGINSFGTTIGPLLLSYAIFGDFSNTSENVNVSTGVLIVPYLILAALFIIFGIALAISQLPPIKREGIEKNNWGALRFPQLRWGMLALFVYVGVEVAIQSNLPALMEQPQILGLEIKNVTHFISLYWGCLMIGRWTQAVSVFNLKKKTRLLFTVVVPFLAYGVVLLVNYIKGSNMADLHLFLPMVALLVICFLIVGEQTVKSLVLFGSAGTILMAAGILLTGKFAVFAFVSGGLFLSILWPCIFSIATAGLGKYTNQGSALLIMMIIGGALIPPFQGWISDSFGIHISYIVPLLCFLIITAYGIFAGRYLRKQGIEL